MYVYAHKYFYARSPKQAYGKTRKEECTRRRIPIVSTTPARRPCLTSSLRPHIHNPRNPTTHFSSAKRSAMSCRFFGQHYPQGQQAVNSIYGDDGTWRKVSAGDVLGMDDDGNRLMDAKRGWCAERDEERGNGYAFLMGSNLGTGGRKLHKAVLEYRFDDNVLGECVARRYGSILVHGTLTF